LFIRNEICKGLIMWLIIKYLEEEIASGNLKINKEVNLLENFNEISDFTEKIRLSPIFSYVDNHDLISLKSSKTFNGNFVMFFPKDGGQLMKKLIEHEALADLSILVPLGLCSIVIYTELNFSDTNLLIEKLEKYLVSYEIWKINANFIEETKYKNFTETNPQIEFFKLDEFEFINDFPLFQELISSLLTFKNYCAKYSDIIDLEYDNVKKEVQSILEDFKSCIELGMQNRRKIFQLEDSAIQLISNISYVTTQSFTGLVPILERRSILRRHTIFGTGNSIRAVNQIVQPIT